MRIGDGPAAVTGDDRCILSLILSREGAASRMNRESEDLPEWLLETIARTASNPVFISLWINRAIPDRFFDPGFFLSRLQTRPSFAIDFALHRREEPHAKECSNTPHRFQVPPKNGTFLHPVGPSLSQVFDRLLLLFPFMLPPR